MEFLEIMVCAKLLLLLLLVLLRVLLAHFDCESSGIRIWRSNPSWT